ncbi:MAG: ParA family protein [Candidatus Omnitrophica bacterium]|nr:ParA family protein [Candidatus Omnitrophota bacterium]MDD5655315.1 ParA family protein [Candidatus Omnitrophota bacterium]
MLEELKNLVPKFLKPKIPLPQEISSYGVSQPPQNNAVKIPRIVAVVNQKGGCAKTTSAINVSACLAQMGHEVLLVDMDPQANASLGIGVDIDNLNTSIYDVLINNLGLDKILVNTGVKGLDIAPASSVLSGAQLELADLLGRESILKIALRKHCLIKQYDYIFIDCSPSLNLLTINALVAANSVLIPIQTHYYSLEGMRELFSTIDIVRERLNSELQILGIVATMFDGRTKLNRQMLQQIQEYFKEMVFKTVINNNIKLCEASLHKKPVTVYDGQSKGARDYMNLAREIAGLPLEEVKDEVEPSPETAQQESV